MLTLAKMLIALLLANAGLAPSTKVSVPTTASLRGLSVVSANVVWASGTGGTVIKTIDGGKTWSVIVVPGAETLDFRGIRAWDDEAALIISSGPAEKGQARIFRTQDGGKSWQQVFEEKRAGIFFDAIAFWDRRHGILLSDPIDGHFALFRTDDGGASWRQIPPAALPSSLPNEGAFAASNSCLTVQGDKHVWFATGGAKVARVFRSSDRGKTWSVAETPMHPANASSGIFSLAFSDEKSGVAVGGDYARPEGSELPSMLLTLDGGKTWQASSPKDPPGLYLSSVAVLSAPPKSQSQLVLAAGIKGLFSGSAGDGAAWRKESDENLNTIFYGAQGTWVVGPKGTVLRQVVR
jgi:photosystem II stability/assembly factor-like uncharacterized protein